MVSRNRPSQSQPPILGTVKSLEAVDKIGTTSVSKGEKRKRKALASRVPTAIGPTSKKSRRGAPHRGTVGDKHLGS